MKKFTIIFMLLFLVLCSNAYAEESTKNVALGKTVTANTGDTPSGITDGDTDKAVDPNAWRVQMKHSNGAWATINLEQEYVISKIIVYNGYRDNVDSKATEFSIYYASIDSPDDFKLIRSVKGITSADNQTVITLKEPVGAAYIRFVSDTATANVMRIREIEAYEMNSGEKKVYALYHGYRRTREYDGDLGTWKQFYLTPNSFVTDHINYNADIVDENGNHSVASANGEPVVGMQSDNDPDYMEYQILLAKMSGINGFMVDFSFPEHGNTVLLNNLLAQSAKYNFEIGVNYSDSSLMEKDWITNYRDDIVTREDRLNYLKTSIQYLLDNVYSKNNAAKYNNHPIMYIFGGGLTNTEMSDVVSHTYIYPNNTGSTYYIRRSPLEGTYNPETDTVSWADAIASLKQWKDIGVDVYHWITPRNRKADGNAEYDYFANQNDINAYMSEYSKLWGGGVNITSGFVFPGMNNYACGGWGENPLYFIDRNNGELYKSQWEYQLENKNNIDIMFIGSWSDFTEGHEIAPTVNTGYREIKTTLEYASKFKGKAFDENDFSYIELPQQLFEIRKQLKKYAKMGVNVTKLTEEADKAAMMISDNQYSFAHEIIANLKQISDTYNNAISHEQINVDKYNSSVQFSATDGENGGYNAQNGVSLTFNSELAQKLKSNYFDGKMQFCYFADNTILSSNDVLTVRNSTKKPAPDKIGTIQGGYGVTAQITKENTQKWETVDIDIYNDNCAFEHELANRADFTINGSGEIKEVSMLFDVQNLPRLQSNKYISVFEDKNDATDMKVVANSAENDFDVFVASYNDVGNIISIRKYLNSSILSGASINIDAAADKIKVFIWSNGLIPMDKKITVSST